MRPARPKIPRLDLRARQPPGSIVRGRGMRPASLKIPRAGPSGEDAAGFYCTWPRDEACEAKNSTGWTFGRGRSQILSWLAGLLPTDRAFPIPRVSLFYYFARVRDRLPPDTRAERERKPPCGPLILFPFTSSDRFGIFSIF